MEAITVEQYNELQAAHFDLQNRFELQEKALVKAVHERNKLTEDSLNHKDQVSMATLFPELYKEKFIMENQMQLAERFSKARAFKDYTPEQIYTLMKAGEEMNLKPIEALQSMYIVNGCIDFYGDKMIARITERGYKVEYIDETKESVKVRVSKGDEVYEEIATIKDDAIIKSNAIKFAPKNKLRFHGVRMIASFYLPHLFKSIADMHTSDYISYEEVNTVNKYLESGQIIELIDAAESKADLTALKERYKKEFAKSVNLTLYLGKAVKKFE